jgi:hypothetical protein
LIKKSPVKKNAFQIFYRFDCHKYFNSNFVCICKSQGKEISENLFNLINEVSPEKNVIIDKFDFGIKSTNAFRNPIIVAAQNEYCNKSKCLNAPSEWNC